MRRAKPLYFQPKIHKKKQRSITSLEKAIQRKLYPAIKERDKNRMCSSCDARPVGRESHAGHYDKAELCNILLRYYPFNINKQCSVCNKWRSGNTIPYRKTMLARHGQDEVNYIETNSRLPLPLNFNVRYWLEVTLDNLRGKTNEEIIKYMIDEVHSVFPR